MWHTVGQILLLLHQPIAEDTLLDIEACKVGGIAESQVGDCRIRRNATFDGIGEGCACHLAWAAQGHLLGWVTEHAGREGISHIV